MLPSISIKTIHGSNIVILRTEIINNRGSSSFYSIRNPFSTSIRYSQSIDNSNLTFSFFYQNVNHFRHQSRSISSSNLARKSARKLKLATEWMGPKPSSVNNFFQFDSSSIDLKSSHLNIPSNTSNNLHPSSSQTTSPAKSSLIIDLTSTVRSTTDSSNANPNYQRNDNSIHYSKGSKKEKNGFSSFHLFLTELNRNNLEMCHRILKYMPLEAIVAYAPQHHYDLRRYVYLIATDKSHMNQKYIPYILKVLAALKHASIPLTTFDLNCLCIGYFIVGEFDMLMDVIRRLEKMSGYVYKHRLLPFLCISYAETSEFDKAARALEDMLPFVNIGDGLDTSIQQIALRPRLWIQFVDLYVGHIKDQTKIIRFAKNLIANGCAHYYYVIGFLIERSWEVSKACYDELFSLFQATTLNTSDPRFLAGRICGHLKNKSKLKANRLVDADSFMKLQDISETNYYPEYPSSLSAFSVSQESDRVSGNLNHTDIDNNTTTDNNIDKNIHYTTTVFQSTTDLSKLLVEFEKCLKANSFSLCEKQVQLILEDVIRALLSAEYIEKATRLIILYETLKLTPSNRISQRVLSLAVNQEQPLSVIESTYRSMLRSGVKATSYLTYQVIRACLLHNQPEIGIKYFKAIDVGIPTQFTLSLYIQCLMKLREVDEALDILLKEYPRHGLKPSVHTYSRVMNGLARTTGNRSAVRCFQQMIREGVKPNSVVVTCLMQNIFRGFQVSEAFELLQELEETVVKQFGPEFRFHGLVTGRYLKSDNMEEMLEDIMKRDRHLIIQPTTATFPHLIQYFTQFGLLTEANVILKVMLRRGMKITREVYTAMLVGFVNIWDYNTAIEVLQSIDWDIIDIDLGLAKAVISVYRKTGRIEEGKQALKTMLEKGYDITPLSLDIIWLLFRDHRRHNYLNDPLKSKMGYTDTTTSSSSVSLGGGNSYQNMSGMSNELSQLVAKDMLEFLFNHGFVNLVPKMLVLLAQRMTLNADLMSSIKEHFLLKKNLLVIGIVKSLKDPISPDLLERIYSLIFEKRDIRALMDWTEFLEESEQYDAVSVLKSEVIPPLLKKIQEQMEAPISTHSLMIARLNEFRNEEGYYDEAYGLAMSEYERLIAIWIMMIRSSSLRPKLPIDFTCKLFELSGIKLEDQSMYQFLWKELLKHSQEEVISGLQQQRNQHQGSEYSFHGLSKQVIDCHVKIMTHRYNYPQLFQDIQSIINYVPLETKRELESHILPLLKNRFE